MTEKEKTVPESRRDLLIEVSRQRLARLRDRLSLVRSKLEICPEAEKARWELAEAELTKSFEQEQARISKLENRPEDSVSNEIEVLTPSFEIDLASVSPAKALATSAPSHDIAEQKARYEQRLAEFRKAEQQWKSEKAQLLASTEQLEVQVEEMSFELTAQSQLRDSLEAQLASVTSVDRAASAFETEIAQLKREISELLQQKESEDGVRASLEQQVAQLKDKHEAQLAILFDQEDAHALDKSQIEKQMLDVKNELSAKIADLTQQLESRPNVEAATPSSEISELQEENARYQAQNTHLQERLDEYFNELERRLGELQELRPLVATAEVTQKNLEEEIQKLQDELALTTGESDELIELRAWKQKEMSRQDELQRDLEAAQQLVDEAVERKILEASEHKQGVERLEAQLTEALQSIHLLNEEHTTLQNLMTERDALLKELQTSHSSSQDSHAQLQAEADQREVRVTEIDLALKELQQKHELLEEALVLRERELFLLRPLAEGPMDG